MKIYKQEKNLYSATGGVVTFKSNVRAAKDLDLKLLTALAEERPIEDLFPLVSILATTNWNENDHVFLPEEVYKARNSPQDHPINVGHNENKIVGHLTRSWCVDESFNIIDDSLPFEQWPSYFHLATAGIIYTAWREEENTKAIAGLIDKIESGVMAVSMECMFPRFDYMLRKDGIDVLVERTEDTAFLSKYLKHFGGTGEFDGQRIGMVLRDLFFTGKGFTENPANKESRIIASGTDKINLSKDVGVTISTVAHIMEKNKMSLELELEQVKTALAAIEATKAELEASKVALASDLAAANEKINELNSVVAGKEADLVKLQESVASAGAQLVEAEAKVASLVKEIETMKVDREAFERKVGLQMQGLSVEDATAAVELYKNLSKDQWDNVAGLLVKSKPAPSAATASVVEPASVAVDPVTQTVSVPQTAVASVETDLEKLQAALAGMLKTK